MSNAKVLFLFSLPVALGLALWISRPFDRPLAVARISVAGLSGAQIRNITQAARRLDGATLWPGERFSFNRRVGPRTAARGYVPAPTYVEKDSPDSVGGGICVVSSATYQAALIAGLPVRERVPHLRATQRILPGYDAAVWYGQADLAFTNALPTPLQINASVRDATLRVTFSGRAPTSAPGRLARYVSAPHGGRMTVRVARMHADGTREWISRDLYGVKAPDDKPAIQ